MATYRNLSDEMLIVGWNGRRQAIEPDETIDVSDEIVENVDLNDNFVRVDSGSVPPAPAVDPPNEDDDSE